MPKKEDLDWSSWKHKKKRFLCPYCGNDAVTYEAFKKSWRCVKCDASFIRPTKHAPAFLKALCILIAWIITIAGLVFLLFSSPDWVGIVMIAVGILFCVVAVSLVTHWR